MTDQITTLAVHVIETLPDSIERRRRVLSGLAVVLPPGHRCLPEVRALLELLDRHSILQRELPLEWTTP